MFTLDEIQRIHEGLTGGLPEYARKLNEIGVTRYVSYISDGHSVYVGPGGAELTSAPVHESLSISGASNIEKATQALSRHEQGLTTTSR